MDSLSLGDVFTLFLITATFQGFLLGCIVHRQNARNKNPNRYLVLLLYIASFSLLLYLLIVPLHLLPHRAIVFLDSFAFLFAPLLFLFVRKTLAFSALERTWSTLLFTPAFLHFCYGLTLFRYSEQQMDQLLQAKAFTAEWTVIFILLILWSAWLWCLTAGLVYRRYTQNPKNTNRYQLRFLIVFLIALFLGIGISACFALDFFFGIQILPFTKTYIGWILVPFVIYGATYSLIDRPELLRTVRPRVRTSLNDSPELKQIKAALEHGMRAEHLYRNPTLSLKELSEKLQIGQTKLSKTINQCYHCNFYDFVNRYRLQDFVEKISLNEHKKSTLIGIAYDVGFNSKTTFNKSFKRRFKITPKQYIDRFVK